jgi:hypothetical protein
MVRGNTIFILSVEHDILCLLYKGHSLKSDNFYRKVINKLKSDNFHM